MKFWKACWIFSVLMLINVVDGCNFGFGNLGLFNFGVGNVGFGNKGFLNAGLLNTGFATVGIRNIGAGNFFPIPNTIAVANIPVAPNLTPPIGKKRRRRSPRLIVTEVNNLSF